jgi:hypothetical protein
MRWVIAAALIVAAALAGCPAFHDNYPGTDCTSDTDCYQGETCVMKVCTVVQPPDFSMQMMFHFDFAMPCDTDLGCVDLGTGDM